MFVVNYTQGGLLNIIYFLVLIESVSEFINVHLLFFPS